VLDKARMDPGLIADLRERSRPLRPEASLTRPSAPSGDAAGAEEPPEDVLDDLIARLEHLEERLRLLEGARPGTAEIAAHTLFLSTATGYTVVERDGPPPLPGDEIELDGNVYRAQRFRRSPFPADSRPCVIVEPGAAAPSATAS
jgi:hypothetical protein